MSTVRCFSYIQRGSSTFGVGCFVVFLGFCFFLFFFLLYLFCSTAPAQVTFLHRPCSWSPPLLWLAARAPMNAGASGWAGDWPAPGDPRGTRGPYEGVTACTPSPWPAPPLSCQRILEPPRPICVHHLSLPPRSPWTPFCHHVPSATSLPHQRWLPSTTPCFTIPKATLSAATAPSGFLRTP